MYNILPVYIEIKNPVQEIPFFYDEENLDANKIKEILLACPTIDITKPLNRNTICDYLKDMITYYFDFDYEYICESAHLVNDIEDRIRMKYFNSNSDDIKYGRIFCRTSEAGKLVGGISDKGLIMYYFLGYVLSDAVGVDGGNNVTPSGMRADDFNFYPDTFGELVDTYYYLNKVIYEQLNISDNKL